MAQVLVNVLAQSNGGDAVAMIIGLLFFLIYLGLIVVVIAGGWQMFVKAGQPGWGVIIPIYNIYLVCKIVGRPGWWTILMFVPLVSVIIGIILAIDLAKSFGRGVGTAIGLILLGFIFIPILGFGSAEYEGPAAAM
ncbi:DUF5684 domain-containing protein [Algisphaera agarilytica]|uniref:Uncharacterized membrane protein YhaH (DUF805 family) n=1 Tax=Algisphaera agarilytica TaxID=1385975 RepID=A0A7X0H4I5_9BACT|nr:DUF5684 domain-containing protein [Algisphaera agarilytica]MBB6428902.1 uncharacterized membrane protein YhaH (DUF805 family) [Algisphaera agarilytica]